MQLTKPENILNVHKTSQYGTKVINQTQFISVEDSHLLKKQRDLALFGDELVTRSREIILT